nr:exodeoxyribonuclease 1 [Quercus suber]
MGIQGQTLGVDAYGWLHRGTFACAVELAQQKPTRRHIDFALNRVRMLIHFGVKPYIVFDGDDLPSKAHTEQERAARRKESKRLGLELLRTGRESQAQMELQKAVDVTPLMARELIEELKLLGVPYIVAPYEADSQLVYLEKQGIISGILSEDSDLLVFGAKCLLTKLDQYGEIIMVNRADFTACWDVSLVGWTDHDFRMMSMLSGCDYLPGIAYLGLKTAYRLIRKHKNIENVIRSLQFDGKKKVPDGYLEDFTKAERTFLYQWVFCPEAKCLLNLTKLPSNLSIDSMPYIGQPVDPVIASGVATGDLHPTTKERIIIERQHRYVPGQRNVVQTPDEKPGKSITEFFKPKRTPLAELDPNSFTPSPSQQRLLQNQTANSWSASQVPPARPPLVPVNGGLVPPSSAPQATRRNESEQLQGRGARLTPKRQRLCSENVFAGHMKGDIGLSATSRFFQPNINPSPTLRKSSTQRKREDFSLWSDTPATNALNGVTSPSQTPSPKKRLKLQVYADPPNVTADGTPTTSSAENTQSTTVATTLAQNSSAICETPNTSLGSTSRHSVFSEGVNASFAALKSSFAYEAADSSIDKVKRQALSDSVENTAKQAQQDHASSTPPKSTPASQRHIDIVEDQAGELDETIVPCSSPPGPKGDCFGGAGQTNEDQSQTPSPIRALGLGGSEDLLVPASPCSEEEDDGRRRPTFDLGRFAFTG